MTNERIGRRPEQPTETEPAVQLSDDDLYRSLSSTPRRRLLYLLLVEEAATIEKIATVLAGWDATETGTMVTQEEHEQIKLELHHIHIPYLADAGFVTVDDETGTVRILPMDDAAIDLICQSVESEGSPS